MTALVIAMKQTLSVIIGAGIPHKRILIIASLTRGRCAPGQCREVTDGLNATYKRFIFYLKANVQLPGSGWFDTQMEFHTATQNTDVSLA